MLDDLILHEDPISGNCYKIRLTAALLGLPLLRKAYDIRQGDTRRPEFLETINSNGRIPVLQIGERFLPESNAACYWLAEGSDLLPSDRFEHADMLRWMFFEQYSHEPNVATLRFWLAYLGEDRLSEVQRAQIAAKQEAGRAALHLMESHLRKRPWFVGRSLSLADIVLFAYTHIAEDGGAFDLSTYPAVREWIARLSVEPGFVALSDRES